MCNMLAASPNGYYAWRKRPDSKLKMANDKITEKIKEILAEFEGKYGSPRIYQELQEKKIPCSENRVARLMQKIGLRAKHKRPPVSTRAGCLK